MKKKDPNYAIKIEKAIAEKYGEETVQHPRSDWDDEKEKEYLSQLKELYSRELKEYDHDKINQDGVFIPRKLINKNSNRSCSTCNTYSFKSIDDVYMTKFDCCYKCYIQWVEGREERWNKGWRPNNG
jgi:phage FluMu gp28-like protein